MSLQDGKILVLQTTKKCNFLCEHCIVSCNSKSDERISINTFNKVVEFIGNDYNTLMVHGGEPFLFFKDLLSIIEIAKEHNINTEINTNAYWAKLDYKNILKELEKVVLFALSISIDKYHLKRIELNDIINLVVEFAENSKIDVRLFFTYDIDINQYQYIIDDY